MALANILTSDKDVSETKTALTRTLYTLSVAAEEYARASLGAANSVLEVAMNGGAVACAYSSYADITKFDRLARHTLGSITDITNILLAVNESEDDFANEAYSQHLTDVGKINQTVAFLESAETRVALINKSLPQNPQPAARFDMTIFQTQKVE